MKVLVTGKKDYKTIKYMTKVKKDFAGLVMGKKIVKQLINTHPLFQCAYSKAFTKKVKRY